MKRRILLLLVIVISALCSSNLQAQSKGNIAWLGTSTTTADTGYVRVLKKAGYNVVDKTAVIGKLTAEQIADLSTYDLIFCSRVTSSGNYTDTTYNMISAPIVNLASLVARTSRWDMFAASDAELERLDVVAAIKPTHPIFTGVTLSETNTVDIVPAQTAAQNFRLLAGAKSAGNGSIIAVNAKDSLVLLAEWKPGIPYHATAKKGTTPKGKRMVFFAPFGYQLNAQGDKLLLNIAEYMITGKVYAPIKMTFITENAKSDSLYIDLLGKNGFVVNTVTNLLNVTPSDSAIKVLEASNVIVFSRNTNSGGYQALTQYNAIKTPMMLMSAFMARNSRWQVLNSGTAVDNDLMTMSVKNAGHPIFKGISFDPTMPFALTNTLKAGTCDIKEAGNGTVIATSSVSGRVAIAEWSANTEFYTGSTSIPQGHRMVFFLTGAYDLTPDAQTLYVNAAKYLATYDPGFVQLTKVTLITEDAKSDKGFIELLNSNTCTVNVVTNLKDVTPSDSILTALESADVILFSKNTTSGAYQALTQYNNISTPIMLMNANMAKNSRWQVLNTGKTNDFEADSINVAQSSHKIFEGVTVPATGLKLTSSQKISTLAIGSAGNGTILATSKAGNVMIAEWAKNTKYYTESEYAPLGQRMAFFSAGTYDLTPDAQTVFVNAVKYLATLDYTFVNNAPTDISLSNSILDEAQPAGTLVGMLSAVDTDPASTTTFSYSLVAGDGTNDADNGMFEIMGDKLITKDVLDYEIKHGYAVNIQVSDGSLTFKKPFVIQVNNVIETGVNDLQSASVSVYPNPFTDKIYVGSKEAGDVTISIYNITGQAVYQKSHYLHGNLELNPKIQSGIYIMKVDGKNVHYNTRIVRK